MFETSDVARRIAADYASPGAIGRGLAALATGADGVTVEAMLWDAEVTQTWFRRQGDPSADDYRLGYLIAFLRDAVATPVVSVDSAYGHRFIGADDHEQCLTCGVECELVHTDVDNRNHGRYVTFEGGEPEPCE